MNPNAPDFGDAHVETYPGPPRMFPASDLAGRQMQPRPWLVEGWIPAAQVTDLRGDGGGGKSTVALMLAISAVTGRAWLGQAVARGPVIVLASEDDEDELHRRIDAIAMHQGVEIAALSGLHLWPLATDDPALVTAGREDTIQPTARWAQLLAGVDRIKPVCLILDSRADVFSGAEVSRAQVRGFIAMLRALAIKNRMAVVLLSHPSLIGGTNGSGSSGSTHWTNAVRAALYLRRPDDPDVNPDRRVLEVIKSNYAASGLSLRMRWAAGWFELEEGGEPINRQDAADRVDAIFLRLVAAYAEEGRRVSHNKGPNFAPAIFARDPRADGVRSAGFTVAMMRLLADRRVIVEEVGPASKRRQQLAVAHPVSVAA